MKKLLRMICLTLALCMLAGCGAGGAQPTPSGAFRQTGEAVEPATAQELAAYLQENGAQAVPCDSTAQGLETVLAQARADDVVCICGSLYMLSLIHI